MLTLIADENAPNLSGLVADFIRGGIGSLRNFTSGDESVAVTVRTVKKSANSTHAYEDTWQTGDTLFLGIGYAPNNLALAELTTALPVAAVTRTLIQAASSTANQTYSISFTEGSYDGLYSITATVGATTEVCGNAGPLFSASELLDVFLSHSLLTVANTKVTQDGDSFIVEFLGGTSFAPTFTVTNVDLVAPLGVTGTLIVNTDEMVALFAAGAFNYRDLPFEITRLRSGSMNAVYVGTVRVFRSVVNPASAVPIPLSMLDVYIAARAVLYDRAQALSDAQKLRARTNIGAAGAGAEVLLLDGVDGNTYRLVSNNSILGLELVT